MLLTGRGARRVSLGRHVARLTVLILATVMFLNCFDFAEVPLKGATGTVRMLVAKATPELN